MASALADLLVIGGGPAGYAAAFRAADLGRSVVLVEPEPMLGGTCLLRGCIPSKAMINAAETMACIRAAGRMGIEVGRVSLDLERLGQWRRETVQRIGKGLAELARRRNVQWVRGRARFLGERQAVVEVPSGEPRQVRFNQAVVATGSRPHFPAGLCPDGERVIGSAQALELTQVPHRLLVVGGGYIGLELGTCWRLLGSEVTMVELTGELLPGTDPELVRPVMRRLQQLQLRVLLNAQVTGLSVAVGGALVSIERTGGERSEERFDRVLVCTGRGPNTASLDLERAGVTTDPDGYIECDQQGRTKAEHIFAAGDCCPGPPLAHKARRDGVVAAEAACGRDAERDQRCVPAVVFSDPEVACCGLSEPEAKRAGIPVQVGRFPFAASGRAATQAVSDGLVKLVADPATGRVLGVGIVGPMASELIAEAALAVELGATVNDLVRTIHAHPTLSEALPEAAELVGGASLHIYKSPRRRR